MDVDDFPIVITDDALVRAALDDEAVREWRERERDDG